MNRFLAAAAAFVIALPLSVSAATVNINYTNFAKSDIGAARAARDAFMGGPAIGEEFESFTACKSKTSANCDNGRIITSVGTFTGITPSITNGGSQVGPKDAIVVRTSAPNPYGRFNTTLGGANWLDSNDLAGILWTLAAPTSSFFQKISFFLTDIDDVGDVKFNIQANGEAAVVRPGPNRLSNGALYLVTMDFNSKVSDLSISMVNGKGDGFGFDSAQVQVAPVPVPAAGFLLLGALGGLMAMRRRRNV